MTATTVLITGATNGIGRASAVALARRGFQVMVHGRSQWRVWRTVRDIRSECGRTAAQGFVADLADRRANESLVRRISARTARLDVVVHNAATVPLRRVTTREGLEMQFAVNHLSAMLLTYRLIPLLRKSVPARVIVVASQLERNGRLDFDDLQSERSYDANQVYATTKLANVLFASELARRLAGSGVTANSLHPGIAGTGILNALVGRPRWQAPWTRYSQPDPVGAIDTIVRLATDPALEQISGRYFRDLEPAEPSTQARNPDLAAQLWSASATLLGLPLSLPE